MILSRVIAIKRNLVIGQRVDPVTGIDILADVEGITATNMERCHDNLRQVLHPGKKMPVRARFGTGNDYFFRDQLLLCYRSANRHAQFTSQADHYGLAWTAGVYRYHGNYCRVKMPDAAE